MKNLFLYFPFVLILLVCSCQTKDSAVKKMEALCLSESEKIAGMSEGLVEYCVCAAPKILVKFKDDQEMMNKFDRGEFLHINDLDDKTLSEALSLCVNGDKLIFNPPTMEFILPERAENGIRVTIMDQMDETFHASHNMDQYCDCYLHAIKTKLTFDEFHARDLEELPKYKALLKDCEEVSRIE